MDRELGVRRVLQRSTTSWAGGTEEQTHIHVGSSAVGVDVHHAAGAPRTLDGMTIWPIMGTETEYGISVAGNPAANAMLASSQIVNAYAAATSRRRRARWDFEEESPLRDLRGFDMAREAAGAALLTDEEIGLANVILTNGARLYVDHAHPEFSGPETSNPLDAVRWDKAGELVMRRAAQHASAMPGISPGGTSGAGSSVGPLLLYKNNVDNKGASYGSHENYLMDRTTPFPAIVQHLVPFFVSRQVVTGAGRVGIGQDGSQHGFQLSQRADYIEVEVGLETTLKRPIVNTRDEPHADPERHRRLHVIIGDANLSEISIYLKVGTTALVLAMVEADFLPGGLDVEAPVSELHRVSHDPGLRHLVELTSGRRLTAVQLQMEYLEQARKFVEDRFGADVEPMALDVLDRWESVLTRLERDPMLLVRELDWVTKLSLLEGYRARDGIDWSHARLHLVDLQYSDVRAEKGLYHRLAATGRVDRLLTDADIVAAVTEPPEDTRAYFRGRCLAQYPDEVAAASWDSVIFDLPGQSSLQRVPTMDPARGTKAHVGALLDRSHTARDLVATLAAGR